MTFDKVIMVDWSGGNDRGARPVKDAIWASIGTAGVAAEPVYLRNRQLAEDWLTQTLTTLQSEGHRVLVGFDLCFAYPAGFAKRLVGSEDTLALWDWFEARVQDDPKSNNRFDLAGEINALFPGTGPFWGNGLPNRDIPHLPRKGLARTTHHGLAEKRAADIAIPGSFSPWQLAGAGAVGGQVIMGLPVLARLRRRFRNAISVWPFQAPDAQIVLAETYFSLLPDLIASDPHPIKDAAQVALYARAFSALPPADLATLMDVDATSEGWVLGAGQADKLRNALSPAPPPLKNDCFAMPQGAHWTPIDEAHQHLRDALSCVAGTEQIPLQKAANRFLAQDVTAARSHPPTPNAAVDGYGFAGPAPAGVNRLTLIKGRAAAGAPYQGSVPQGHAVRILTGANLPNGVDTVVLQEDVSASDQEVSFHGPLKQGANARNAGEDMQAGQVILHKGRKVTPADLGMLAAAGVGAVSVRKVLKVGVLSTGDELREPGDVAGEGDIYDANRPMLSALVASWGYNVIDLGRAPDNRDTLRGMLDHAATQCDVILSSGGASAGDEDHMSALLENTGSFALWRIAMKPGRPLALGLWQGTPVFGLPGNPVAAMVCALVFAAPSLAVMAGGTWHAPTSFQLPAAFSKSKKAGRREYLRARVEDGQITIFPSEGSGRVSGLSWATGLVELGDPAQKVAPGDLVTYIPFDSF